MSLYVGCELISEYNKTRKNDVGKVMRESYVFPHYLLNCIMAVQVKNRMVYATYKYATWLESTRLIARQLSLFLLLPLSLPMSPMLMLCLFIDLCLIWVLCLDAVGSLELRVLLICHEEPREMKRWIIDGWKKA